MCLFYMSLQKVLEGYFQLSLLQRLSGDRHQSGQGQTPLSFSCDRLVCGRVLHESGNPREQKTTPDRRRCVGLALLRSPGPRPERSVPGRRVQSGCAPRTLDAPPPGAACRPPGSPPRAGTEHPTRHRLVVVLRPPRTRPQPVAGTDQLGD